VTARNGDGPNGAVGTTEAGEIVEFGNTNDLAIAQAENLAKLQELARVLAELFPATFTAEQWQPHRPLKCGIDRDLVDRGVLLVNEIRIVFRRYCSRLMYQRALAAGGPRYDLDGEPAGEVTADQMAGAKAAVAAIEAKRARKAKAIADERKAARKNAKTAETSVLAKAPREAQPANKTPPAKSGLSLDGLREAARARREAVHG
jgi:ProP effector